MLETIAWNDVWYYLTMALMFAAGILGSVEIFISNDWNRFYFRRGVRIFRRRYSIESPTSDIQVAELEKRFFKGDGIVLWPSITFKRVGDEEIFFHERWIEFRVLSVLHRFEG